MTPRSAPPSPVPSHRPRVLITSGPGSEPIDAVRRITNHSTGELGARLAAVFAERGCEVICLEGRGATHAWDPGLVDRRLFLTNDDLLSALSTLAQEGPAPTLVLHAAALCDYRVARIEDADGAAVGGGKLDSRAGGLRLHLEPAIKVISRLRALFPASLLVGWKYETEGSAERAIARGEAQLAANDTDACVVNGPALGPGFALITPRGDLVAAPTREALATELAAWLARTPARAAALSLP